MFGEKSLMFIDERLIALLDFTRQFFGKPITINNWHLKGGTYQESGFRTPTTKTGAPLSQHRFGRAADIKVEGMSPFDVYNEILHNEKAFMELGLTTMEDIAHTPTWNHLDIRYQGEDKIVIVKP